MNSILDKIKSLIIPEISELQRLEREYKSLCQKRIALNKNGHIIVTVEAELDRVTRRMNLIQKQRNQERQEDYQLLQAAYTELDEEFPNMRQLVDGDRFSGGGGE